jgi:hypothetical protein
MGEAAPPGAAAIFRQLIDTQHSPPAPTRPAQTGVASCGASVHISTGAPRALGGRSYLPVKSTLDDRTDRRPKAAAADGPGIDHPDSRGRRSCQSGTECLLIPPSARDMRLACMASGAGREGGNPALFKIRSPQAGMQRAWRGTLHHPRLSWSESQMSPVTL